MHLQIMKNDGQWLTRRERERPRGSKYVECGICVSFNSEDDATVETVQYRNPITGFKFTKTVVPLGVCCTPPVGD